MSKINKNHIKNMISLYKQGKSCSAIAKIYNVNRETIRKYLHKNNVKIKLTSSYRKYSLNINFFDEINTEEKAYILGLLYADGCNSINMSSVNLVLQEKDKDLLETINKIIGSNKPLSFRKVPNRKGYKCQNQFCLHISSKHISQRMIELGCPPKKSLILKFPTKEQVPLHLIRHFIRGYFDGDGCISLKHNKYINLHFFGTKEFCDKLNDFFNQKLGYKLKMIIRKHAKNNLYGLIAYKQIIAKDIFNLMYKDANIYLERKYKKFIDNLN